MHSFSMPTHISSLQLKRTMLDRIWCNFQPSPRGSANYASQPYDRLPLRSGPSTPLHDQPYLASIVVQTGQTYRAGTSTTLEIMALVQPDTWPIRQVPC